MTDPWQWADEIGPEKVMHLHDAAAGLRAVVAIDNTAAGPSIGGVRMAKDVSAEEAFRLARAMTFKNAAAGLPHGGGKSVVVGDPHMSDAEKETLIRAFAQAIRDLTGYIPGPDMGTDERCMAWIRDEIGRAVGLPPELGGIPLDEIGATGLGLAVSADVASRRLDLPLAGARVAIQGYGNVGRHAARFLAARGAVVVAVSDSGGVAIDAGGLALDSLDVLKREGRSVADLPGCGSTSSEAILDVACEIWIPAARPDVVTEENVDRLDTRLVLQGANIPFTPEAERILHTRGVLVVPDFIANAGGVICASVEYHGGDERQALQTIETKIAANVEAVLEKAQASGQMPRAAAVALARERVRKAAATRRWHA
ncbi:MAG TPA: Glu/Leu/Phe/Val dehydrogenase [Myxococcota bacterium]|nr:Glu/Leu/Phe/Val dehydrogenase [Myxococcota bacterium]